MKMGEIEHKKQKEQAFMPVLARFAFECCEALQDVTDLPQSIVLSHRCGQSRSSSNDVRFPQHRDKCFLHRRQ